MALPFLFYSAGWLNIICLLPFLYYLSLQKKFAKGFITSIWAIGVVYIFVVVSWIASTRPDNWAYIQGWQGGIGLLVIYILLVGFLSVQFILFGWLYKRLRVNLFNRWSFVVLPSIWVVSEVFRSYFFSILSYGPNGSIGPYWNFGVLGFAAGVTPLGYAGRLIGLYGLSFVVVAINLAFFWMLNKRYKLPLIIFGSIILLSLLGWVIFSNISGSKLSVAAVQLPPTDDNSLTISYQKGLAKEIVDDKTIPKSIELFLLPEYSEFYTDISDDAKNITTTYLASNGASITSVSGDKDKTKPTNDLVVYTPNGDIQTSHKKQFLIPVGEYMPYVVSGLLQLSGQKEALNINETTQSINKGNKKEPPVVVAGRSIGALACSAAIAPELYRSMVVQGAEVLTNSASLGTFTHAPLYHAQSRQMARFDAIANARPFVQASTGAFSYFIDSNGKFIYRTTKTGLGFKQVEINTNKNITLYSKLGEWVSLLSFVLVITLVVKSYARK